MSASEPDPGAKGGSEADRSERLADPGVLRRVEHLAIGWTALAGAALAGGAWGDGTGAALAAVAVLTAVSGLSIVAFRGLQWIVSAMGPADQQQHRTIGWRQGLAALVRLCLLGALVVGGSFLLDRRFAPALVLGFSTLPAALMTEGLLQMVRALRGKEHDGFS